MDRLIVNYTGREKRFALLKDDQVEKIIFDRPEQRSQVGNIYYGTVTKVLPGMNAVFIDIGTDKNAYMHRDTLPSYVLSEDKNHQHLSSLVHQGEKLLVQVDKDATGTKGPRVTGIIEFQGDNLIYMPKGRYVAVSKKIADEQQKTKLRRIGQHLKTAEEGIIIRTSSLTSSKEEMAVEWSKLRLQYEELVMRTASLKKPGLLFQKDSFMEMLHVTIGRMTVGEVILDDLPLKQVFEKEMKKSQITFTFYNGKDNIFSANRVEQSIDKALKRVVWLDKGAYLVFDETEALTIIDVNTGKFSGKGDYQETVLKTNQLAAIEIAHQLRLRDSSGIVLIDFIDMKRDQDRLSIMELMERELKKDEKRTKIIGFTALGIMQLTRKKTKVPLSEALQVKCPLCDGTGRILSAETIAFRLERELLEHRTTDHEAVLVETTKEVKEAFAGPNETFQAAFEESLQLKIYFSVKTSHEHYYILKQFGEMSEISRKAAELY
ncbi:Rne/Rng family ribonuclease [Neobacillus massiliamazoniensis]|uniref:Ribonuclease, Rne/Rng family n=1 Tax=Neobacillus massiliamazoniensis TaxID=1499688 RepID=A0A0U1P250_9BACI|nr:Rne/Rng family ribonuclease [Neobacillus massiliamazoniensis]CRK84293.1 ribonuclease, Rne/Rng family [Neobacillus massiliamazoniensis]